MATNLPTTFKLCDGLCPLIASALEVRLRTDLSSAVKEVQWSPSFTAWQVIGTDDSSAVMHVLRREAALCHVIRQELVSMIPVAVLRGE